MVFLITDVTGTGMAGGPDGAAAATGPARSGAERVTAPTPTKPAEPATGPVRSEEKRIPAPTQTTAALPSKIFQCRMGGFLIFTRPQFGAVRGYPTIARGNGRDRHGLR